MCKLHTSTNGNYSTSKEAKFIQQNLFLPLRKKSKAPQSSTVNTVIGYSFKLKILVRQGNNF